MTNWNDYKMKLGTAAPEATVPVTQPAPTKPHPFSILGALAGIGMPEGSGPNVFALEKMGLLPQHKPTFLERLSGRRPYEHMASGSSPLLSGLFGSFGLKPAAPAAPVDDRTVVDQRPAATQRLVSMFQNKG